jgi:L-cysteine/cystine lyase
MTVNLLELAPDQTKVASIREELPAVNKFAYFNTGTNGPLPRRTHEAMYNYARTELEEGRIRLDTFAQITEEKLALRHSIADLLGCDWSEVALTHNTTEGMNIAIMGLNWQAGDEAITAVTEHPGGLYPLYLLKQRYGIKIRQTNIGLKEVDPIAELKRVLNHKTKAVVLSHICWSTGMVLPIKEICDLAHQYGAMVIIDAAQSGGMISSKVYDLGVDAYAISGQKWLCGPDSTGGLFVRKDCLSDIWQTFVGYEAIEVSDYNGFYIPSAGSKRYSAATHYPPAIKGLRTSLGWLNNEVGWDWAYARIKQLGEYCYAKLAGLEGVTMYTPRDNMAGLVSFKVAGIEPVDLSRALHEQKIVLRSIPNLNFARVSTGFYNTEEEIDRLVELIPILKPNS